MIGTLLQNRYRVDATLGEGGMGVVYRAHDTLLDRPVAIKVVAPALVGVEGGRRLLREAQSAARLQHPNIAAVFDAVEQDAGLAIVMELVEGQTLRDLFPLPLPRMVEMAIDVLKGLEYAHGQGIVHRDLKPENIIVTPEGTAKLMDFGLARSEGRSRLTQAGMVVGTVAYMAPEQALSGAADARSDLYALGCVLYEGVAGRPPFEAEDPISVITQHINVPPVAPRFHNAGVPPHLEGVILKLLAKDPNRRYRSAQEAGAVLEQILGTLRDAGPPAPLPEKVVGAELVEGIRQGMMVGRASELDLIKQLLDEAASGGGKLVFVGGDAGIGKTRLIEEVITYAHLRGARVFSTKCYEGQVPYEPFTRIIRDLVNEATPNDAAVVIGEHAADLARIVPGIREKVRDAPEPIPLPPDKEKARILEGFTRVLVNLSARAPLVLVLDDLHQADRATLELLRYLSPEIQRRRLIVIAAFRSEDLDRLTDFADVLKQLLRERHTTRVTVGALSLDEVGELMQTMAGHRTRPVHFARRIHEVTEGNPYFIEQVIQALFEQRVLYLKDGQWSTDFDQGARYAEMPVPASILAAVEARLQPLSEECRRALIHAAVLGRQFSLEMLAQVLTLTEDRLLDLLDEALHARLIKEVRVSGEDRYEFAQAMTREALYDGISRHRRRRLHGQVGQALETVYGEQAADHASELAAHFLEAGDDGRSILYALLAAEKAETLFAHEEAIRWYETARELLEDSGQAERVLDVAERLALSHFYGGRPGQSVEIFKEMLADAEHRGDRRRAADLNRKIGHVYQVSWDFASAVPYLEKALAEAGQEEGPDTVGVLLDLARAHNFSTGPHEARALAQRALDLAEKLEIVDELARANEEIALAHDQQGSTDEGHTYHLRAIELAKGRKTYVAMWTLNRAYNNMAVQFAVKGDFVKALQLEKEGFALAEAVRIPEGIHFGLGVLSGLNYDLGDWEEARGYAKRQQDLSDRASSYRLWARIMQRMMDEDWAGLIELARLQLEEGRKRNSPQEMIDSFWQITDAHQKMGQYDLAEQSIREAIELAGSVHWGQWDLSLLPRLAQTLLHQRRYEEADQVWTRLWEAARKTKAESALARPEYLRGQIELGRGRIEQAVEHFQRALDVYRRYPRRYEEADVHLALARAYQARGEPGDLDHARDALRSAIGIYTDLNAPRSLPAAQEALARLEAQQ